MANDRKPRRWPRRRIELPVKIVEESCGGTGEILFDTGDLSLGGAFLRSTLLFELDEELELEFELPDIGVVRARGRVVRLATEDEAPGMGVSFTSLSEPERDAIRAFLSKAAQHGGD